AAAGASASRTASAESSKPAAPASEASTAAVASSPEASSASPEQKEVEQELAQRSQQHDQENCAKNEQLFSGQLWLGPGRGRELWSGSRQSYAGILRDDIGDPRGHQ